MTTKMRAKTGTIAANNRARRKFMKMFPYTPISTPAKPLELEDEDDLDDDMWGKDTQSPAYQPQKVNIPEPAQKIDLTSNRQTGQISGRRATLS